MISFYISGVEFILTKEHAGWYEALYRFVQSDYEEHGFSDHGEEVRQDLCPWEFI